jgi:membrane-bound lytic murein transglycosylase A
MRPLWALVAAAGLVLAGCATAPPPKPVAAARRHVPQHPLPPPQHVRPPAVAVAPPQIEPVRPYRRPSETAGLNALPGWADEDHLAALAAFQAGCGAAREPLMRAACQAGRSLATADDGAARAFFEDNFRAEPAGDGQEGVLTAYFAPQYEARAYPDAEFSAPVRPKPGRTMEIAPPPAPVPDLDDLIDVALSQVDASSPPPATERIDLSNAERATIDRSPTDGALAWMRPEDLFYLQIQGSGVLVYPDGRRMKAAYTADNGKPFVAIARPMVGQGLLGANGASGDAIRGWLAAHRGPKAQAVMWLDPRYVFFTLTLDDGREPAGAAGVPLPAGRAIAVDPGRHAYGEVFWIDASAPVLTGGARTYRRMVMALDTGAAIRGEVRADLYVGSGAAAGSEAGRVRHTLKMTRLVPLERDAQARPSGSAARETTAAAGGG